MRRFRDRRPARLFRGSEFSRLMLMIGMLFVLAMLIYRARDADVWRFFTGEHKQASPASDEKSESAVAAADKPTARPRAAGDSEATDHPRTDSGDAKAEPAGAAEPPLPLDEDPEQRAAFEEEVQAITDHAPLAHEEMFAYWRLLGWADAAKLPDLLRRAKTDVRLGELIREPAAHRGQLIKVRLHLRQNLVEHAPPDNPYGIDTYYQAVGWNDSSGAWFYFCVYHDLPPDMPVGDDIEQLGTFVGYFLKTTTYLDRQGKTIQAPILIGRMVWHPLALSKPAVDAWDTPWLIAGLAAVWFAARFILRLLPGRKRSSTPGLLGTRSAAGEPAETVESWLDRAQSQGDAEAINQPREHESNGNGVSPSLDRSDGHEG